MTITPNQEQFFAYEPEFDDCDDPGFCHFCGGERMVEGSDMGDPLWYDVDAFYECPCCRGSGMADDCTFW